PGLGDAVLYLPLDETNDPATGQSVTRFANQAGLAYSQYEAVCANCPAAGSQGWLGHAVSFDGVNDELLVNGLGAAVTGGAVSLSAWVYPEAAAGQGAFLTLGGRQLLYDAGAQTFVYADGGGQTAAAGTFGPGQWYQVTAVFPANGAGALYVNGLAAATLAAAGPVAAADDLTLGAGFAGRLDDTAVFNRDLTAAEVKRLFRAAFPVLNLTFDDADVADGGQVRDESRFGQTAVFHGGSFARPEPGIVGSGAFRFDGANDWIELPGDAAFDLSDGEYTQLAWVYPQNGGPVFDSVMSDAGRAGAYPFLHVNGAQATVGFGDGAAEQSYTSGPILTPNAWNFVAVTFDGTTLNLYVNGALAESTNQFAGLRPAATTRFNIGYRSDAAGAAYFAGRLDNLAVYRQALTAAEIAGLWRAGWQPAALDNSGPGVTAAAWTYPLPDGLRGSYQIRLRSTDVNGSRSLDYAELGAWEGLIDDSIQTVYLPVMMNAFANLPDLVVSDLRAVNGGLQLTVENRGPAPVTDEFWVDVYLNPATPPTAVNQTWDSVGNAGLVWGVTASALPLNPGDSLTLAVGDAYYRADYSRWSGAIPAGTVLYAQVDSANINTNYGAVRETHEVTGGVYNNIIGPVTAAQTFFAPRGGARLADGRADGRLAARP
ncbi:MAG TPA: LamG domain-containing protein, partial [Anaerolineae bacterium]|nr:LamG domain-containing protein [Anaerolineae bacterium]